MKNVIKLPVTKSTFEQNVISVLKGHTNYIFLKCHNYILVTFSDIFLLEG
jgi:hypothetical protein